MTSDPAVPFAGIPAEQLTTEQLADAIALHNERYFVLDAPLISDAAFDRLVAELRSRAPDHPLLLQVGAPAQAAEGKVEHQAAMLSLDKCYTNEELQRWAKLASGSLLIATPKIDGLACSLVYRDGQLRLGATRGDGLRGENITHNARKIPSIRNPLPLRDDGTPWPELEVRGEVYLPLSVFRTVSDQFANPRNLAAGMLKAKEHTGVAPDRLQFLAYDVLGAAVPSETAKLDFLTALGFQPTPFRACHADDAQRTFDAFAAERDSLDVEVDGVVFKFDDVATQQRLGTTSHHPRGAVAYKFAADAGMTTLRAVEWSVSRTGTITPVAIVEPVQLSGATVTRATLHNLSNLKRLGLKLGDAVELVRRGGVIPHLETTHGGGTELVAPPEQCPGCGAPTRIVETTRKLADGVVTTQILMCERPAECMASRHREILHYCATLELEGFGEKVIDVLLERGLVSDVADLYTLSADQLAGLPRFGPVLIDNLLREVDKARTVDLAAFLRALGIDSLGKHAAEILARRWTLDEIRALAPTDIAELHSLGAITGQSIVDGLHQRTALINKLLRQVRVVRKEADTAAGKGPLAGHVVVFTGALQHMTRRDAQQRVVQLGGLAGDSVTKETTWLVVAQDELDAPKASSKLAKARKLQAAGEPIKILSETEFMAAIAGAA